VTDARKKEDFMKHIKLNYASDATGQIRGMTLAHLHRNLQLAMLVAIAAGQIKLIDPTMVQLAAIGGVSVDELWDMRRQVGAPIRPKRPSARKANPTPAPSLLTSTSSKRCGGSAPAVSRRSPRWSSVMSLPARLPPRKPTARSMAGRLITASN
jgi:hypothetical protein